MGWTFRARKTFRLGPLFATFTQRGFASWGVRLGPITHNFTRRSTSVDTPGPGGIRRKWGGGGE